MRRGSKVRGSGAAAEGAEGAPCAVVGVVGGGEGGGEVEEGFECAAEAVLEGGFDLCVVFEEGFVGFAAVGGGE